MFRLFGACCEMERDQQTWSSPSDAHLFELSRTATTPLRMPRAPEFRSLFSDRFVNFLRMPTKVSSNDPHSLQNTERDRILTKKPCVLGDALARASLKCEDDDALARILGRGQKQRREPTAVACGIYLKKREGICLLRKKADSCGSAGACAD